jgi:septal ring factor EnvC (AmiA/AmiB activator)
MSSKPPSPFQSLVDAADAFAQELRSYQLLSEAFHRAPMVTAKHLERINDTINQIAASEQRLGEHGQALAKAVAVARDEQERLARATLERIPALKARTMELGELLARFDELGREAGVLNESIGVYAETEAAGRSDNDRARDLAEKLEGLTARAQEVTSAAREAEFEELARRGHALHQQLAAAQKKLRLATVSEVEPEAAPPRGH